MPEPTKAFVSYSWAIERDSQIVAALGELCSARGIELVRDENALKHGELIKKFMDELSQSDHVITVFSKPYFQSKWCMYELLSIYQRGDFQQRTHPIIADNCNLQDSAYRLTLVKYWEEQYEAAKLELSSYSPEVVVEEYGQLILFRDIYQNINKLMTFAAGRLTTPLAQLQAHGYAQLLDVIKPVASGVEATAQVSDEDFLLEVRQSIDADLRKSEPFLDQVIKNCNIGFGGASQLVDHLLAQCVAGHFVEVIQSLQSAFVDCSDELGEGDIGALKKLYQAAEGIVSKLVLFNVRDEWMRQYRCECGMKSHHDHVLPNMSFGSVEVVSSREARTIPKFHLDRHNLSLQGGKGIALESGCRTNDVVRDVIKRLYFRVMDRELGNGLDEKQAVAVLQKTIQQRKQQKNLKLRRNYFLLIPGENSNSALADTTVQDTLKGLLPDLSFIRVRNGHHEETFIVEDEDLMVAISEFFTTLEDCKSQ